MRGSVVKAAVGALDRVARSLGPENPDRLPKHSITGRQGEEEAYFYVRRQGYIIWRGTGGRRGIGESLTW